MSSSSPAVVRQGIKIVCISDTHSLHGRIPGIIPAGDVLIHCGDFTNLGKEEEIASFMAWMSEQPHPSKLLISGNHDMTMDSEAYNLRKGKRKGSLPSELSTRCRSLVVNHPQVEYLEDTSTTIKIPSSSSSMIEDIYENINVYGTPWQPKFWGAFQLPSEIGMIQEIWAKIPSNTDILMTHGPPKTILDLVNGNQVGCDELLIELTRVKPRLHIFGHIHECHGAYYDDALSCLFVNASTCTLMTNPTNSPIVVFLPFDKNLPAYVMNDN
jgi:predicted phosphodiesterase